MKNVIIVLGLVILISVIDFAILKQGEKEIELKLEGISLEEKELIEAWIKENDLNQYGDPKDTVYIGGTPLFNEMTGETINRYEYILRNHLDRPWR